jgi:hypothetical protein
MINEKRQNSQDRNETSSAAKEVNLIVPFCPRFCLNHGVNLMLLQRTAVYIKSAKRNVIKASLFQMLLFI